jgi:hypothetical protein
LCKIHDKAPYNCSFGNFGKSQVRLKWWQLFQQISALVDMETELFNEDMAEAGLSEEE